MATTITFSATGTVVAKYPIEDNHQTIFRLFAKVNVDNAGETVTIVHGEDYNHPSRAVRIYNAAGTLLTAAQAAVTLTDAQTTTIAFAAGLAAAGPMQIVIEY